MGPMGQKKARCCFEVCQVVVQVGRQTTTVLGRVHQNMALGAKSAMYD